MGQVVIVTNAKKGWVELSSFYLLPRVHRVVELYIPVISAQDLALETKYQDDVVLWKGYAF